MRPEKAFKTRKEMKREQQNSSMTPRIHVVHYTTHITFTKLVVKKKIVFFKYPKNVKKNLKDSSRSKVKLFVLFF